MSLFLMLTSVVPPQEQEAQAEEEEDEDDEDKLWTYIFYTGNTVKGMWGLQKREELEC